MAAGDDGQAADARADVPELVLAAKHAPGCAAALVCASFMGLEMWWGGGGIRARADLTVGVVVVVLRVEDAGGGAVQAVAGRPLARHHHPHAVVQPPGALAEQAAGGALSRLSGYGGRQGRARVSARVEVGDGLGVGDEVAERLAVRLLPLQARSFRAAHVLAVWVQPAHAAAVLMVVLPLDLVLVGVDGGVQHGHLLRREHVADHQV